MQLGMNSFGMHAASSIEEEEEEEEGRPRAPGAGGCDLNPANINI